MNDLTKAMFADLDKIATEQGEGPEFFAAMERWLYRLQSEDKNRAIGAMIGRSREQR